jgi:hypothetical protein
MIYSVLSVYFFLNKNIFFNSFFHKTSKTKTRTSYIFGIKLLIILFINLLIYLYLISFNPIINNIFWKSFNIEILNKWFCWLNIKSIVLLILWLLTTRFSFFHWIFFVLYSFIFNIYTIFIIFTWQGKLSLPKLFHTLIILILISNLYFQYSLLSQWVGVNNSYTSWFNEYGQLVYRNNISTEVTYTYNSIFLLESSNLNISSSFFHFYHNMDTQFFTLNLTEGLLKQVMYNHTFLHTFKVVIYDNPSLVTDCYVIVTLILIINLSNSKLRIMS